jgi:hypothetical protein
MRHIRRYNEIFENESGLSHDQIVLMDSYTTGEWKLNPQTGLVDVNGDFNCSIEELSDFKGIRFGKVTGDFSCSLNRLTTLEGAPEEVGGDFTCSWNGLTNLKGAPKRVGGNFRCVHNVLLTLEGAPEEVGGNFYLDERKGFPWTIEGKSEYLESRYKHSELILGVLSAEEIKNAVSKNPTLLVPLERRNRELYNKVLKELGWDKMGPDLLRQLKDGIL